MNLQFDLTLSEGYKSKSQIARKLTEDWVLRNSYCPNCGNSKLNEYENNRPAADFFCIKCEEDFELKSKKGKIRATIPDGAYSTMIKRVNSENNPNFFLLSYTKEWSVQNFLIIPKQFFTESIIIKRPPLALTAKRAGWVGCNIDISQVPDSGKVFVIKNSQSLNPDDVKNAFNKTLFLRKKRPESKGWILDVLKCVDSIESSVFTLDEVYKFESKLKVKYPHNNFIKDKIRQQLQMLRDKGFIEFIGRGKYKKNQDGKI